MTAMQWHWTEGRSYDGPTGFDPRCDVCRDNLEADARNLGRRHGREDTAPYGDLADAGSADLMTALGETSETTDENFGPRLAALNAYREGWEQGAGRYYPA